jgi:hypothetical protein
MKKISRIYYRTTKLTYNKNYKIKILIYMFKTII